MEQIHKQHHPHDHADIVDEAPAKHEKPDLTVTDELLDEIDQVLEENAQEFVQSYIQKGGE